MQGKGQMRAGMRHARKSRTTLMRTRHGSMAGHGVTASHCNGLSLSLALSLSLSPSLPPSLPLSLSLFLSPSPSLPLSLSLSLPPSLSLKSIFDSV